MRDSIIGVEIEEIGVESEQREEADKADSRLPGEEEVEVGVDMGSSPNKGGRVYASRRASALSDQIMKLMEVDATGAAVSNTAPVHDPNPDPALEPILECENDLVDTSDIRWVQWCSGV